MVNLALAARSAALVSTVAVLAALGLPAPAAANGHLTVISGSQPTAYFEVLGDVAEYAGFFKDEGVDVDTNYAGNPYSATQLVASGKGDICSIALEPIIQGYDKGVRLTSFFARDPHYEYVLAVPEDSPIKTLSDFKGASIGEYSPGSGAEVSTNNMLEGAGLKKSDYSYIPIGNGAQAINALVSKKVAAAAFPYVELAIYVVNFQQKYRYFWHPILKDIGDVGYAASPDTLKNKSDELKRFSRAIAKAAILIRVNPKVAARYFLQGEGLKPTPEAIDNEAHLLAITQDQLPGFDPTSKTIGKMSANGMGFLANFLYQNGLTKVVVPTSSLVSDEFIAYANDFDHVKFIAQAKAMK
jgi:NitT/TauT family transport system substrate-binding protein